MLCFDEFSLFSVPQPYRKNRHVMEVHQKEKRHFCKYCDKSFFKMSSKKRHELTHVEHDTWKCNVCSKTFKDQSSLKYHTQKRVCQAKNHAKTDKDVKDTNNAANSTRNVSSKNQIVLQRGERLVASTILGI